MLMLRYFLLIYVRVKQALQPLVKKLSEIKQRESLSPKEAKRQTKLNFEPNKADNKDEEKAKGNYCLLERRFS